ncbi:MAG: HAD-IIB family hydrolase [Pseudomonadales bacterium]
MKYSALAIDLDGTLLVGEDLPEENARALRAARDAGMRVIIATARWKEMAFKVADIVGLTDPVIACSGAQVHLRDQDQDLFDERLPADFTQELFDICNANRCVATVTVQDRVLIKLDGEPDAKLMGSEMHWVPQLLAPDHGLPRIAAVQGSRAIALIRSELQERYAEDVNIFDSIGPSGRIIITITAKRATKGAALAAACAHMRLDTRSVIAFGDAENDLAMFRVAGAAVAMGQADDAIKQAATIVTGRNDEAGVAMAVDRLLSTGSL